MSAADRHEMVALFTSAGMARRAQHDLRDLDCEVSDPVPLPSPEQGRSWALTVSSPALGSSATRYLSPQVVEQALVILRRFDGVTTS